MSSEEIVDYETLDDVIADITEDAKEQVEENVDTDGEALERQFHQLRERLQRKYSSILESVEEDARTGIEQEVEAELGFIKDALEEDSSDRERNIQTSHSSKTQESAEEAEVAEELEPDTTEAPEEETAPSDSIEPMEETLDDTLDELAGDVPDEIAELKEYVSEISDEAEIYESYSVWRLKMGDFEVKIQGRDGEFHNEAKYVASEEELIEDHDLDSSTAGAVRNSLKNNGNFEIYWGDLVTEVPEEMTEALAQAVEVFDYNPENVEPDINQETEVEEKPYSGEDYRIEGKNLVIERDDQPIEIPVFEEGSLSEEAEVLAYLITRNENLVEWDGDYFDADHWTGFNNLEEKGVAAKDYGQDGERTGKDQYILEADLSEEFEDDFRTFISKSREGTIALGRVESRSDEGLRISYNGTADVVEEENVDYELNLNDEVVVEYTGEGIEVLTA